MYGLRAIWHLVFVGLLGCCLADAAVAQGGCTQYRVGQYPLSTTPIGACNNYINATASTLDPGWTQDSDGATAQVCRVRSYVNGAFYGSRDEPISQVQGQCGNQCEELAGQPACDGGICFIPILNRVVTNSSCHNKCRTTGPVIFDAKLDDGSGYVVTSPSVYLGIACDVGPPSSGGAGGTPTMPAPFPNPPPPGKCPGTINGVEVFVNCSSTSTTSTASTTRTTGTGQSATTSTDSTTSNTQCANGRCTTTQTTSPGTGPSGSAGSPTTSVTSEPQESFCAKNPTAPACKAAEESSFGGSCSSSFQCTGDAAQCAAAKGVWESRCALRALEGDQSNPVFSLGTSATSSGSGDPSFHPKNNKVTKDISVLDRSNPYGNTCPGDVSIASGRISVPLSQYCSQLQMMGRLLVAFSLFMAAVIIIKGI